MLGVVFLDKISQNFIAFLDTFGHPKYTHKIWEKSKIGNKSYGASKFSIMGHHYTDVVDMDGCHLRGVYPKYT